MISDALIVAQKDLAIERRARVVLTQILPFAAIVLILFAFAFNKYPNLLHTLAPGLFWVASAFCLLLALQRAFTVEGENEAREGLVLYGIDPAGVFLGKALALALQTIAFQVFLGIGIVVLYNADLGSWLPIVVSTILGSIGLVTAGALLGALLIATKTRDSLLPMLALPVLSPVLLSATMAWEDAASGHFGIGDPWIGLLLIFAVLFTVLGAMAFGSILEE